MNDFELFDAMNEAEKRYNKLNAEFRKRGLHKKPYCEFSKSSPTPAQPELATLSPQQQVDALSEQLAKNHRKLTRQSG